MGVWLQASLPLSYRRGGQDAYVKLRHRLRCDVGTSSDPVGSTFHWSQSVRGD